MIPPGDTLQWYWDDGEWDWELSLRDEVEDIDCGYVAIVPLKNGRRFEHRIKPPPVTLNGLYTLSPPATLSTLPFLIS